MCDKPSQVIMQSVDIRSQNLFEPAAPKDVTTPYYTKYGVVSGTYDNTYFRQTRRIHTVFAHTVIRFQICARSAKFFWTFEALYVHGSLWTSVESNLGVQSKLR